MANLQGVKIQVTYQDYVYKHDQLTWLWAHSFDPHQWPHRASVRVGGYGFLKINVTGWEMETSPPCTQCKQSLESLAQHFPSRCFRTWEGVCRQGNQGVAGVNCQNPWGQSQGETISTCHATHKVPAPPQLLSCLHQPVLWVQDQYAYLQMKNLWGRAIKGFAQSHNYPKFCFQGVLRKENIVTITRK